MSNLNSILLSLKKSLTVRGSSIEEVIKDFDRRNTGFISTSQFQRLISSCGVYLPPNQYDIILKSFSSSNNLVDLDQFSKAVMNSHEEVKSIGEANKDNLIDLYKRLSQRNISLLNALRPYDRNNRGMINKYDFLRAVGSFPSSQAISEAFNKDGIIYLSELLREYDNANKPTNLTESTTQNNNFNQNQQKPKPAALENAFKQSIQRKIDFKESFFNVDRLKTGTMSQSHFQTALSNSGLLLTPSDTTAITRYYQCDYDLIDYFHFLRDAEQYRIEYSQATSGLNTNSVAPVNMNDLIKRVSSILFERKVHPSQLFPPNSTLLTRPQFSSVLRQSGLGLSVREIDSVCNFFELENDKNIINVQHFVSSIQSSIMNLSSSTIKPSFSLTGVRQRVPNHVDLNFVLNKLSTALTQKGLQLAPRFQRFDREMSGEFNVSLVNAVIKNLGIEPLSEEELDAIQSRYQGSVYPNIKWQPFAAAVDPSLPEMAPTKTVVSEKKEAVHSGPPTTLIFMMQYIKQTADRNRMNLLSEFRSIDRIRAGFLQPSVFTAFMIREFTKLNRQHIDQLLSSYGNNEFHYIDFCRDIERIDRINSQKVETTAQIESENQSSKVPKFSQYEMTLYSSLLRRIKAFCTLHMLNPNEIFHRYDTNGIGFIRSNNIEGCFSQFQIPVTKEEIALILKMCTDPNNTERVFYQPFTSDVENTKIEPGKAKWILNEAQMKKDAEINAVKVVSQIKDKLKMRNRNIAMYFADAKRGVLMGKEEFASRIEKSNIIVQGEDFENLICKYKGGTDANGNDLVNWEEFVHDVSTTKFFV